MFYYEPVPTSTNQCQPVPTALTKSKLKTYFMLLFASVFLLSCAKDENIQILDNNTQLATRTSGQFAEYEQAFYNQKNSTTEHLSSLHPLWYNINIDSAVQTDFFAYPTILVNVESSSLFSSKWARNQVMISKIGNNNFAISSLFYLADST